MHWAYLRSLAVASVLSGLSVAQCDDFCDSIRSPAGAQCGVDPNDGSMLGILALFCPCSPGEQLAASVTYTGINGGVTTSASTTSLNFASSTASLTFDYAGQNTAIQSGSPVSVQFSRVGSLAYGNIAFTYSPVTSIYYAVETDTVTTTTGTETTTTSTATVTSTTAISQTSSTIPCTTGTATVTGSTATTFTTSTITPPPKTKKRLSVAFTTTHLNCLPGPSPKRPYLQERGRDLLERQVNVGSYEVPYCPAYFGDPEPTTYTTSTQVMTETSTTTDTSTAIATSTDTTTVTPTPLTTTVCSNVAATTTTTPTATSTVVTTAKQSTTTTTYTYTYTQTIYPWHPKPCNSKAPPAPTKTVKPCPSVPKKTGK